MDKFAWDSYSPHFVGLDDIFHRLDSMSNHNTNYPPYNLIKHDTSKYTIEIALAGFKPEEIEVSTESNILKVATKIQEEILMSSISTVEYQSVPLLIRGNSQTMLKLERLRS